MQGVLKTYTKLLLRDPVAIAQGEATFKYLAYLIPSRIVGNREELFQTFNACSKLLRMVNDTILRQAIAGTAKSTKKSSGEANKLVTFLSILNTLEVIVEMVNLRLGGEKGRSLALFAMEILRVFSRGVLLLKHGHHTFSPMTLLSVNRSSVSCSDCSPGTLLRNGICPKCDPDFYAVFMQQRESADPIVCPSCAAEVDVAKLTSWFHSEGARSAATIQATPAESLSIEGSSCSMCHKRFSRAAKAALALQEMRNYQHNGLSSSALSLPVLVSEALDIFTPLVRMILQKIFGRKAFTPFVVSLISDTVAVYLRATAYKHFKPHEKQEHKRKLFKMIFYLLRSPVLDKFTRSKIELVLVFLARFVPFGTFVATSVSAQLDTLEQLETYQWSS